MHKSVLLKEVTDFLSNPCPKIHIDATLGLGGHAKALLEVCKDTFLIGIDKDENAIEIAKEKLKGFNAVFYHGSFKDFDIVLKEEGLLYFDSILFDFGVSSLQLDEEEGFSFQREDFLDMRMDKRQQKTAYIVINTYKEKELADIFYKYGEERLSKKIARSIVEKRKKKPIETTKELADIVSSCYPYKYSKINPATKVFQALRIEVNNELEDIKIALSKLLDFAKEGSKFAFISFHSLEDRLVKEFIKNNADRLKICSKKPITPSDEELLYNKRARSAKLRCAKLCYNEKKDEAFDS
ncbi:MAG: 16S rRNA (cytosine(1402)-N(4))-methyltransferase RsmH [Hydrogenobaculum sp.]|jgi:16S rRNA (cytosine1402-N4)-methyltransferase